jgi:hypothetical protein
MATPGAQTGSGSPQGSSIVNTTPPGGIPDNTDLILSGIFIAMFFSVGIYFHYRLFYAYDRKFIWSGLCFGFCMARIAALACRIVVVKVRGQAIMRLWTMLLTLMV